MTTPERLTYGVLLALVAVMLSGCTTPKSRPALVEERGAELGKVQQESAVSPAKLPPYTPVASGETQAYIVRKGDTMYSIAFEHGFDYRELAELNRITNSNEIQIGQQLTIPVPGKPKGVEKKLSTPKVVNIPAGIIKEHPKALRIPYSDKALALAEKGQEDGNHPLVPGKPEFSTVKEDDDEALQWGMPTSGKIIAQFSESANRKGVDIAGKAGQAVVASEAGKVVYSGSGLRGYGKLVIIKHNKSYLSAYAHNEVILVKEGQSVSKGQKIAEMGKTDADQVKLHFEIRKFGKPVDPVQYLPVNKS